jgi:PKD domain
LDKSSSALRLAASRADEGVVTLFARSSSQSVKRRPAVVASSATRLLALVLGSAAMLWLVLLHAAPAGALVSGNFGVQQRAPISGIETQGPLQYHGGPVLHSSDAYVVYWDPIGNYKEDWQRLISGYFANVGDDSGQAGDVFALDGQYGDTTGRAANQMTYRGSYRDTDPYPTSAEGGNCTEAALVICLTDRQIQGEIHHLITSVDPPLPGASGTPVYYILTPPGVNVCTGSGSPATCSESTELSEESEEITKGKITHPAPVVGICGYHSAIGLGGPSPIPYVVQPWIAGTAGLFIEQLNPLVTSPAKPEELGCQDAVSLKEPNQDDELNPDGNYGDGLADVIVNDLSIEQRDVVVNPFLTGWYQKTTDAEQGDMCQFNFGPPPLSAPTPNELTHAASLSDETINGHSYYLTWGFNSTGVTSGKGYECWSGVALDPYFTAPNPVSVGDIVGFDGDESISTLDAKTNGLSANEPYIAPVYSWNFGDGSTVSGVNDASVFHSYSQGGEYTVTLTITDSGGNVSATTRTIKVAGGTGGSGGAGASQTPGGSATPGSAAAGVPAPVAQASIISRTLRTLRKGVVVRYSVNEQVAGHFEVLLSRAVARRLGITGAPAVGLPQGSPAEIVIAKAILVTTKGGHNTVHILLSKRTASRLAGAHKVSLMLRLIVRNAASKSPLTTTVLSTATLSR